MGNILAQHVAFQLATQKGAGKSTSGPYKEDDGLIEQQCPLSRERTVRLRQQLIGTATTLFFKQDPLKIVRTKAQYMYDENGIQYLDCINNVAHVGHCHPHVVEAVAKQFAMQCTNSRFLHDSLLLCAERLLATMPPTLRRCFFVNSGSEANDLALRMASEYTGRKNIIVLDHAYHGPMSSLVHMSPHIHKSLKKYTKPDNVYVIEQPDPYRGKHRRIDFENDDAKLTNAYLDDLDAAIEAVKLPVEGDTDKKLCGFWAESMQSCAGQIVLPPGYLKQAFERVRTAGGVCVADEVQVGFGRVGTHFWAFQMQDALPDIVVIGKSMGNGFPVAAVICTEEIAAAFSECGHEFFSTFGGNPTACAAAMAVLDVIENEHLMQNAQQVGDYLLTKLRTEIQPRYKIVGDVRGVGLFIGIELVMPTSDRRALPLPNADAAAKIVHAMRYRRIILSSEGPDYNVIKIKPPMVFSKDNADQLVRELDNILAEMK